MEWRAEIENVLGAHNCLNPMRHELKPQHAHLAEIVVLDKADIRRCDVMLVHYTGPSDGTAMEVFYAHSLGKPIVILNKSQVGVISPWMTYHATVIFDWPSDAIKWIGNHIA